MLAAALCVLAIFIGALPSALAEAPTDLSGEWHFDVSSQNGPGRRDVLFRQEGQRVIGFIESDSASGRLVGSLPPRGSVTRGTGDFITMAFASSPTSVQGHCRCA